MFPRCALKNVELITSLIGGSHDSLLCHIFYWLSQTKRCHTNEPKSVHHQFRTWKLLGHFSGISYESQGFGLTLDWISLLFTHLRYLACIAHISHICSCISHKKSWRSHRMAITNISGILLICHKISIFQLKNLTRTRM